MEHKTFWNEAAKVGRYRRFAAFGFVRGGEPDNGIGQDVALLFDDVGMDRRRGAAFLAVVALRAEPFAFVRGRPSASLSVRAMVR